MANEEIADKDLTKIAALQQKRTLAFVNHFVISTVQFLNNFAKRCEQKLMHFERKLEKINAAMVLLEAKLSSIPEVNAENDPKPQETKKEQIQDENKTVTEEHMSEIISDEKPESTTDSKVKPEYERFLKMVQVGVPLDAVKLKISLEGLDPNEIDHILKK